MRPTALTLLTCAVLTWSAHVRAQTPPAQTPPAPTPQNPSPMVERTRLHERIAPRPLEGITRTFSGPLDRPVELLITIGSRASRPQRLVVHFMGAAFIPQYSVAQLGRDYVLAVVNIGSGSGIYDRTFSPPAAFDALLAAIQREASAALGDSVRFRSITLSGFSAGHGAIRAILRDSQHYARVDAVLLLDGMHTSYVPEGVVIDKGGTLDTRNLELFVRFAQDAMRGSKRFVVTHSEIFPGTFASTTETADYLIRTIGLERKPVLRWGPRGAQQLSEVKRGRFTLLGFAGNTAPDHVDQFQGMPEFLKMVERN